MVFKCLSNIQFDSSALVSISCSKNKVLNIFVCRLKSHLQDLLHLDIFIQVFFNILTAQLSDIFIFRAS